MKLGWLGAGYVLLAVFTIALIGGHVLAQSAADAQPDSIELAEIARLSHDLTIATLCCEAVLFFVGVTYWTTITRITRPPNDESAVMGRIDGQPHNGAQD